MRYLKRFNFFLLSAFSVFVGIHFSSRLSRTEQIVPHEMLPVMFGAGTVFCAVVGAIRAGLVRKLPFKVDMEFTRYIVVAFFTIFTVSLLSHSLYCSGTVKATTGQLQLVIVAAGMVTQELVYLYWVKRDNA